MPPSRVLVGAGTIPYKIFLKMKQGRSYKHIIPPQMVHLLPPKVLQMHPPLAGLLHQTRRRMPPLLLMAWVHQ